MRTFDDICHEVYNSIQQPNNSWTYSSFKTSKRHPKKKINKLGKYLLRRKRNAR